MNVLDKINNGDYQSKLAYPKSPIKPMKPKVETSDAWAQYAKDLAAYEAAMPAFREAANAHRADQGNLELVVFKADLEAEFGLVNHPKADKLFNKAWEMGHSAGLSNVYHYYDDLYELIA